MIKFLNYTLILVMSQVFFYCPGKKKEYSEKEVNRIATEYMKLALETGEYIPSYIDAYYGPDSLKPQNPARDFPFEILSKRADHLLDELAALRTPFKTETERYRFNYLNKQLVSLKTELKIHAGMSQTFEEEASLLYDANPPKYDAEHFEEILKELDKELPGEGEVTKRYEEYRKDFIIPKEKLDTVFRAAVNEARERTNENYDLPENESFEISYVNDKPWSGYNWYQGKYYSLIQINTDLPIYIERAVDLACHEGYPGHHVYNVMLEKHLVNEEGWPEYAVYPLYSPQSLVAEGSANFGIEVAFPGEERIEFEKEVLFPLAGIDPEKAERYYRIQELAEKLSYADNEAARGVMNKSMTDEQAIEWLEKYALMEHERAVQRLSFIKKYRSYVINYNYGRDLIKDYVIRNGGSADRPEKRWEIFKNVLTKPHTASDFTF
jgi:hypothetical protein